MKSITSSSPIVKSLCLTTALAALIGFSASASATTASVLKFCVNPLQTNFQYSGGSYTNSLTVKKVDSNFSSVLSYKFAGVRSAGANSATCPTADLFLHLDNSTILESYAKSDGWAAAGSKVTMYLSISSPTYRQYVNGKAVNKNFKCNFNGANAVPIEMNVLGWSGSQLNVSSSANAQLTVNGFTMQCTLSTNLGSKTVSVTWQ